MSGAAERRRVRARVEGTVQGVGFRPHVHRLATELRLGGFVLNDARGVLLEVEGERAAVERFLGRLGPDAPPLAGLERVEVEDRLPLGETRFDIVASAPGAARSAPIAPDSATCGACLAELWDTADRRHRYPFTTCTDCGPRFTIVRGIPYDRALTTMAGFTMCAACQAEYDDPSDRRFHAEANACPACGPTVRLCDPGGVPIGTPVDGQVAVDPVGRAAAALAGGAIVAVKGIGGYHLACRADDEAAVAALRARKRREEKAFALMAGSLAAARALVELGSAEEALLTGRERPIVLAPRRPGAEVAPSVAPGSRDLGVMLAYSPLHHILMRDLGVPLVLTSGNLSDEPIAYRDDDALERLGAIADLLLVHDRPIETRTDDSVVRARERGRPLVLRRSRGYVPAGLALPRPAPAPILACGAELKSTVCLARGPRAWVGPHVGDLGDWETLLSYREGIAHLERLLEVVPEAVAHDLHPDYLSTAYAMERQGVRLVGVQHHHAHLAACLAEHGEEGPAVGAIFDGTGFGPDGGIWGGEILVGSLAGFRRVAHLWPVPMPGGDAAVREPWRMACAWLVEALGGDPRLPATLGAAVEPSAWEAVTRLARTGLASPATTSAGRLFDAVAALCGLRARVSHEGQAAMDLEAVCDPGERRAYPMDGLDPRTAIRAIVADLEAGVAAAIVSARFHNGLADATAAACAESAEAEGLDRVVLSGGVFQNRRLLDGVGDRLSGAGLRVLVPERLPPNDGGISYGQAAVAARALEG